MPITSVFTIGPFVPCTPLPCKILNTPVMSICLLKQNDGTWVEKKKTSPFFIHRLQMFFFNLCHVFTFFLTFFNFFLELFLHLCCAPLIGAISSTMPLPFLPLVIEAKTPVTACPPPHPLANGPDSV